MPTDYHCEACNLAVQIGWFHYHSSPDGYWAATLGFCQKCGTIHQLEHASDATLPDRMFAQPGPLPIAESKMKGVTYRVPLQDWTPLGESRACGHCGAQNEVLFAKVKSTPAVELCRRCGSTRMKKLNSWMT
jgi:hypothetical protein